MGSMHVPSALVAAVLVLVLAGCAGGSGASAPEAQEPTAASATPSKPAAGEPEPAPSEVAAVLRFTGTTVGGEPFDGASLAGKPAVLWFWAPWCTTCRGQVPNVSALAEAYAGTVNVVGIAGLSDDDAGIKEFAADTSGIVNLSDSAGDIWRRFGIVEQSVFTVIDRNGQIVSEGFLRDDELNDLVATLAG